MVPAAAGGATPPNRAPPWTPLRKRLRAALPAGREPPPEVWAARHRALRLLLLGHALILPLFAVAAQRPLLNGLAMAAVVALAAGVASLPFLPRVWRACVASLGLLSASASIVALSGGYVEASFHFFVMLAVITLYQSWAPFLLAVAYVVVHHGVLGTLAPQAVFNHPAAVANPWLWAGIHGGFILAASVANLAAWRVLEDARTREAELRRLQEQDAFKTRFINIAAHELGTPLTPIRTQLFLLRTDKVGPLTPQQRRSVEVVERNMIRLNHLVTDMLESARIQAGKLRVVRGPVDLSRLAHDAVETYAAAADEAGVRLEFAPADGAVVEADTHRLAQVLINLLSNAVKFTPRGGVVRVEASVEDREAVLRVVDTGAGLTAEQAAQLFLPFGQAHEHHPASKGGTGLGLFICKGIVEAHDGRMWCDSRGPGLGSTFAFALPLAAVGLPPADEGGPPMLARKPRITALRVDLLPRARASPLP